MPTTSQSYYPPNYLMLVVAFDAAANAVTNAAANAVTYAAANAVTISAASAVTYAAANAVKDIVLWDGDKLTEEHRRAELWQPVWENFSSNIRSYERDENAIESLSWDKLEIEELSRIFGPNTSQRLLGAIEELKAKTEELSEFFNTPVSRDAILAAERIVPQLPDTLPEGKIGFDEEGDVFLSFHRDDKSAFLTVEPDKLHLLIKGGGKPSRYFDDVPCRHFEIPRNVLEELSEI